MLRASLAVVYVWFGVLKLTGTSPVVALIRDAVPFIPVEWSIPLLGGTETIIGAGILVSRGWVLRAVLAAFWLHMVGTLLVFRAGLGFQDTNVFALTIEGEFVVKNLVLIAAGGVISAHSFRARAASTPAEQTEEGLEAPRVDRRP